MINTINILVVLFHMCRLWTGLGGFVLRLCPLLIDVHFSGRSRAIGPVGVYVYPDNNFIIN